MESDSVDVATDDKENVITNHSNNSLNNDVTGILDIIAKFPLLVIKCIE